jgi:hypothetical protein
MIFLLPLLGITWLLSVLVPLHAAFHYLFVVGNSLQVTFILYSFLIDWLIDWLMFNAHSSSTSAISWREQIVYILDTYKTLRNKRCLSIIYKTIWIYVQIKEPFKKDKAIYLERILSSYICILDHFYAYNLIQKA